MSDDNILETVSFVKDIYCWTMFRVRENNSTYVFRHKLDMSIGYQIRIMKKKIGRILEGGGIERRIMLVEELKIYDGNGFITRYFTSNQKEINLRH